MDFVKKQFEFWLTVGLLAAFVGSMVAARFGSEKAAAVRPMAPLERIPPAVPRDREEDQAADQGLHYADVVKAAEKFDELILWEGLPSPFESSRDRELATRSTFSIDRQYFYTQPLAITVTERAAMSDAVLKTISNFKPKEGEKLCGGFHADYALEWRLHGVPLAQTLICFTCQEAHLVVGGQVEQVDLSADGVNHFRALLRSHRALRPPPPPPPRSTEPAVGGASSLIVRPAAPTPLPRPAPPKIETSLPAFDPGPIAK